MTKWSHNKLVIAQVKEMEPKELYEELLGEAEDKGYKNGWVAHKFREAKGGWPRPLSAVKPKMPSSKVREYLGIMKNRWKAKKKREELKQSSVSHSASAAALSRDAGAHGT